MVNCITSFFAKYDSQNLFVTIDHEYDVKDPQFKEKEKKEPSDLRLHHYFQNKEFISFSLLPFV